MALSLDAMFRPLNDFFLKLFSTGPGSTVVFRFDKFGSIISDDDFLDPAHPEQGYSPFRAIEKLSEMVNHIPSDSDDGMSIMFRLNTIDQTYYYHLLSPSQPYTADGMTDVQAMINSFSTLKADALKTWENVKLESSGGLMLEYKPALAQPENWYDKSRDELWTHQSFDMHAAPAPPVVAGPPKPGLWRLKLDDDRLRDLLRNVKVLSNTPRIVPVQPPDVFGQRKQLDATRIARMPAMMTDTALRSTAMQPSIHSFADVMVTRRLVGAEALDEGLGGLHLPARKAVAIAAPEAPSPPSLQDVVRNNFTAFRINDRIVLNQAIGQAAPTAPAATEGVKVAFDYCVVRITRPWYIGAFIDDRSWFVPGTDKGALTAPTAMVAGDTSFNLIPVGFVAIKNLQIEANWAATDVDAAAQAVDFGPFKVTPGIAQNKLRHDGMQVIGWLLERMPELPPNAPPTGDHHAQ